MHRIPLSAQAALAALTFSSFACSGSKVPTSGNEAPGSVVARPDGQGYFFADPNRRGHGSEMHLVDVRWGRLVEAFGLDASGARVSMQSEFLISGSYAGDGTSTRLETNAVTGLEDLVVLRDVSDATPGGGREQFFDILAGLDDNLTRIPDSGLGGAGIFAMVPRNATLVLRFDDLLDPNSIDATTIRTWTGVPSVDVFEARVLADPNHGGTQDRDGDGRPEFYPTRVYVDPTVSEVEAFAHGLALPIQSTGFPGSETTSHSNLALRVPTRVAPAVGQTFVLQNLTAHALSTLGSGSVDFQSPTLDVVRSARSGGLLVVTGDPFDGYLPDTTPPRVIGSLGTRIDEPPQPIVPRTDGRDFLLARVSFLSTFCSGALRAGDVLQQPGLLAEVVEDSAAPIAGVVRDVRVRLRAFPPGFSTPEDWVLTGAGPASLLSPYEPALDAGKEACFARISPTPAGAPEAPTSGVAGDSTYTFRFSEPMRRTSFSAFDSLRLTRTTQPAHSSDWTTGRIDASLDLLRFTFLPHVPLAHRFGQAESYFLSLATGGTPPTDLAGNALASGLPAIEVRLRADAATERNGSRTLRFERVDEEPPFGDIGQGEGPLPEFFGQHVYDLTRGMLRPRSVTRFEAVADRTQPAAALMTPFAPGAQEPLSPLGSKLQMLWRSIDANFALEDSTMYNVDIEGLNWSPRGLPASDRFQNFEIRLSHARFLPDEYVCGGSVRFPASGIGPRFQDNLLSPALDPQSVLHPRSAGYVIEPGDLFSASSGTPMMPFPINRGVAPDEIRTYIWRDTALRARGGETTSGAPTFTEFRTRGIPFSGCTPDVDQVGLVYPPPASSGDPVNIRTVALPLLIEFRCFPDDVASGLNTFDVSLSQIFSLAPFFRAHSTGGISPTGGMTRIDPDLETVARGGFDPISNPPGQSTSPTDNISYMGSMDLVVRVSRSHSLWFLASDPLDPATPFPDPRYAEPVVEPRLEDQPAGSRIEIAFRGASVVGNAESRSAAVLDAYGDHYTSHFHSVDGANTQVAFLGDDSWHEVRSAAVNPLGIDGARYYQVRLSFFSDILSGNRPALDNLAVAWHD